MLTQYTKDEARFLLHRVCHHLAIETQRISATGEYDGTAEDALVFGAIRRRRVGHVNLERVGAGQEPARFADHARESRFRQLREQIRVLAAIDKPRRAV